MDIAPGSTLSATSNLEIEIRDPNHNLIEVVKTHNLFVASGITALRNLIGYPVLYGDGYTPKFIGVGSNHDTPSLANTALGTEIFRKEMVRRVAQGTDTVHYQMFLDTTEANGGGSQPLYEVGMFTVATAGVMWARAIHSLITKNSSVSVTYNWRVTFANVII